MALLVTTFAGNGVLALAPDTPPPDEASLGWTLLAWNDLGMHCVDEDFAIFAILPPFNTLNAQLLERNGHPVDDSGGVTLFYEATVDPDGSSTQTATRSNFWDHAGALFGATLEEGEGLAGSRLPGADNVPQPMHWVADHNWWEATGIPVLPIDESGYRQAYPLFRLTARDASGQLLAETFVTAPVSAEMNCVTCHGSGSGPEAQPASGWVNDSDPVRDYRLNILRLHDQKQVGNPDFINALQDLGYHEDGLYATVVQNGRPLLCASCHASAVLGAPGVAGIPPMTQVMHGGHAGVTDPFTHMAMNASENRASCYQCHPGHQTQCLRGAMGMAIDAAGEKAMSCQSCHGGMDTMATTTRQGWFDEPNCQSCHTGTATDHAGQMRFTDALLPDDSLRTPANDLFATTPDAPASGFSLYRFSHGHGGLKCSACHGSPHAIFPSGERNDNIRAIDLQGHVGPIGDCQACHQTGVNTREGGPHGTHTIGAWWIKEHGEGLEDNGTGLAQCQACHGADNRGTALSEAFGPRSYSTRYGVKNFWEGQRISCYDCHRGASSDDTNRNSRPVATDQVLTTAAEVTTVASLLVSDAETSALTVRIVSPPRHGLLALAGSTLSYTPKPGFVGTDVFTFAAHDGEKESNLGTCRVEVGPNPFYVDTDGDGRGDLLERVFGTKRSRPGVQANPLQTLVINADGSRQLRFLCDFRFAPPDLEVSLETSTDMAAWSAGAANVHSTLDHRGRTVYEIDLPAGTTPNFVRFNAHSRL